MKFSKTLTAVLIVSVYGGSTWAAVSAEEAKQLGNNLTLFGAEKEGNKDGSIPEYTGGLPANTTPAGFVKGSGKYVNPFSGEKPLYSIDAKNVDKYADKLSEGTKALIKRYPSFRADIYPSHRVVNYPKWYLDKTVANATSVPSINDGEAPLQAAGGLPFPIPKTGYEVLWNHVVRYAGFASATTSTGYYVDGNGNTVLGSVIQINSQSLYNTPGMTTEELKKRGGYYSQIAYNFVAPPRSLGDATLIQDTITPGRRTFSYSSSTRRIRLAPDLAYDTPITSSGGVSTYDEVGVFFGKMDRFNFKLLGKKEMIIPYNTYDASFTATKEQLIQPKHLNPDLMRWELHRVWVVEATLKPGLRHIYSKFTIYLDEDGSGNGARDDYDASGKLYKSIYGISPWAWDAQSNYTQPAVLAYDLATGTYATINFVMNTGKMVFYDKPLPQNIFTADGLPARSKQ